MLEHHISQTVILFANLFNVKVRNGKKRRVRKLSSEPTERPSMQRVSDGYCICYRKEKIVPRVKSEVVRSESQSACRIQWTDLKKEKANVYRESFNAAVNLLLLDQSLETVDSNCCYCPWSLRFEVPTTPFASRLVVCSLFVTAVPGGASIACSASVAHIPVVAWSREIAVGYREHRGQCPGYVVIPLGIISQEYRKRASITTSRSSD